jgi:murein DD-endopeptidase MepM/ murein hydrolase activator NlpD
MKSLPLAALTLLAAAASPVERGRFSLAAAPVQGGLVTGIAPSGTVSLSLDGKDVKLARDGHFLIAFDRDAGPVASIEARLSDGSVVRERLSVASRTWQVEHVDAAMRPSGSSGEYRRLRSAELARIAEARARDTGSQGWRQRFAWPARGRISGRFGSQRIYRGEPGAYHSGVDVAPGAGATVVAPAEGVVVLAGPPQFSLEGNLVILDHGMGLNSAFLHLATNSVAVGQHVRQGEPIGTIGATGRATGPHLHWSLKWNDARLDPEPLAGPMPR